jgi:RNA polymerase sigma factor (sigma-70 family)
MDYTNQQTLLQGLQKGETAAFEHLREECYMSLDNACNLPSDRAEEKKDLYSDGIEALLDKINKPDFVLTSKVSTILIVICKNKNIDKLERENSRRKYLNELPDEIFEENFEERIDRKVFKGILWKSFKKMKDDCQTLMKMVLEKVPMAEIAKEMGLTPGSIRNKKKNCLIALDNIVNAHPVYAQMKRNNEIKPE